MWYFTRNGWVSGVDDVLHEKVIGAYEVMIGGGVVTLTFWSKHFDQIVNGAHAIASFGGAAIAIHGIWRIVTRHRRRPGGDDK